MQRNEKFDEILNAEWVVRIGQTNKAFGQESKGFASDKAKLDALINNLSLDEMVAYGEYRIQATR